MKYFPLVFLGVLTMSACGSGSDNKTETPIVNPPTTTPPITVTPPEAKAGYIGFESAAVRPIAMTEDNSKLFVTNISNNRLEVFSVDNQGDASFEQSIDVGLEPVAVAISNNQAWVVNHLSDSISIIDIQSSPMHVVRTLLVGDEPRDIVFAKGKAFITTAHRGQQRMNPALASTEGAGEPLLHTPSTERADIWVFDQNQLGSTLGGKPTKIISLFGDTLRGLALSQDKNTLYAGVMNSGNQTTAVHESVMCYGYEDDQYGAYPCQVLDNISSPNGLKDGYLPGGRTAPGVNADGDPQPWTSMIVKYDEDSGQWQDTKGRNFSNGVRFNLPDLDVFAIDTESLIQKDSYAHVGTTLFNLAVSPKSGDIYVSNTEANNATRFEGPGDFTDSTVQGNIAKSRITIISPVDKKVKPRHLNRHIDYSNLKGNGGNKWASLSTPTQLAISQNGETLYNAVIGSNKVAVLPTSQLKMDSFWDNSGEEFDPIKLSENYISVEGGPSGLLLAEETNSLYVYTRFDNALVRIDLAHNDEKQRLTMPTSEPESFIAGRSMLYDGNRSSSNGESSCASCHIFGDTDHLSWNLGNPDAPNGLNPQPFPTENLSELGCVLIGPEDESCQLLEIINGVGDKRAIASMKGPMGTQTMRGMQNHGHMHWRGDRSVGYFGNDTEQTLDERISFKNFIVAFEGLLGLDVELPATVEATNKPVKVITLEEDIDKFADFMMRVALPPNPIRQLDNSLSASAQVGRNFFHGKRRSDGSPEDTPINGDSPDGVNCEGCHGVDHAKGFYGSRGEIAHGGEIQILKVPQLRNLYTRVGMFGLPDREGFLPSHTKEHQGDQIRGFGFLHDGATDQLVNFLRGGVFDNGETDCPEGANERHGCQFNFGKVGIPDEETRHGLVDYLMEFDNDLAPIVGQQITLNNSSSNMVEERISLFEQRAKTSFTSKLLGGDVRECDLIATGVIGGKKRGYFYDVKEGLFRSDASREVLLSKEGLITLARQIDNSLTFTCTVPGKGWQAAIDFDLDGKLNADDGD